jgi:hypothetical protein
MTPSKQKTTTDEPEARILSVVLSANLGDARIDRNRRSP